MNTTSVYGLCLTLTLGLAATMTSAVTQSTLFILAGCSLIALVLTTMVDLAGNRAQSKARWEYVARYGEDPWNGKG